MSSINRFPEEEPSFSTFFKVLLSQTNEIFKTGIINGINLSSLKNENIQILLFFEDVLERQDSYVFVLKSAFKIS